ncbi:MAG TPA: cytochrome c biogenesis protein CcdA [Pseudonocardiaceae bacterium]
MRAVATMRVLAESVLFVLGLAVVSVSLGAAFGSLGDLLRRHQDLLNRVFADVEQVGAQCQPPRCGGRLRMQL